MIDLILNEQQQELAEKNHNLIFWYAKNHRLDIEEYYGELAVALCEAAYHYDESTGVSFSTFAAKCMSNQIKKLFRKKERTIEGANDILSLDYVYDEEGTDPYTLRDCIADITEDIEKETTINIETEKFINALREPEKYVFRCIINEETQASVSEKLGISRQCVGIIVKRIRKKWNDSVRQNLS